MKAKQVLFLRDTLWFTLTSFGGAQAHMGIMLRDFVHKRRYITEEELLELSALAQVLPGPSSTQTLVGVAYKVGGIPLSLITFLLWILPSAALMSFFAISYEELDKIKQFGQIMQFVQPIALGIVAYAGYSLARRILVTKTSMWLAFAAVIVTMILRNAYVFPILILLGGIITSALDTPEEENRLKFNLFSNINRSKVLYFIGILLFFAVLGAIINRTSPFSLPVRLFENFYRNGIIIFGGGQVLVPLMSTEFVEMKHYLTASEFMAGYALQQAIPGPTFSFTSFVGAMALKNDHANIGGQIAGSVVATLGINLPGLILVLFIVPFWNDLKKITRIKNSLLGINAVAVGFIIAALLFLARPIGFHLLPLCIFAATFLLLNFTKIRTPLLILAGIAAGYFF
nr:chromate efflux transporter [Hufsiella ginkgonis]